MATLANKRKEYLDETYDEDLKPLGPVKKGGLLTKVRKNVPIAVDAIKGWAVRGEGGPISQIGNLLHGANVTNDQWDREAYGKWLDQGGVMSDGSDPPPYEEYWKKKMGNKDGPGLDPADPRYNYHTGSRGDGVVRPVEETEALKEKMRQEQFDSRRTRRHPLLDLAEERLTGKKEN